MKFCILMGSPRLNGNTSELCKPFVQSLIENKAEVQYITLADKNILPCKSCYACQNVSDDYGCVQKDDMYNVVKSVIWADCIVLATPIYTWYCPTEMKLFLDRQYGLNKFYGSASGSYLTGKSIAIITTHGYEREYATQPFETGIRHFCEHSKMNYCGMYSVRDINNLESFQTEDAINGAKAFAVSLL